MSKYVYRLLSTPVSHRPSRRQLMIGMALAPLCAPVLADAAASAWNPTRPMRLIVPFPAGGATDLVARLLAEKLGIRLGQPIVVENRGGANGIIAARAAMNAEPDGYTLFLGAIGTQAINPYIYPKMAVDPDRFVAVAAVNTLPTAFAVRKGGRVKSIDDLIKISATGQGNYGHWAIASVPHIAGEMLKKEANMPKLLGIQYKGAAQCLQALLAGEIDIANLPLSLVLAQGDRLQTIGLASKERLPSEPDIPTMTEIGYPVDIEAWYGVFAPPGTPTTAVNALATSINATIADPEVSKRMSQMALKPQKFPNAQAYEQWIKSERDRWASVLRGLGIKPMQSDS